MKQPGSTPSPVEIDLLRACLLTGEEANDALNRWKSSVNMNIDDVDFATQRLLPLLYSNHYSQDKPDRFLKRARGVHRFFYYQNRLLMQRAVEAIDFLAAEGIRAIPLKGMALIHRWYDNAGLRAMSDMDIFVSEKDALKAVSRLFSMGWRFRDPRLEAFFKKEYLRYVHAVHMKNEQDQDLDLHWSPMIESINTDYGLRLLDRSRPVDGKQIHIPHHDDMVLHTCIHGIRWSPTPPFRWIADLHRILSCDGQEVDWDYVFSTAKELQTCKLLSGALQVFDAVFPGMLDKDITDKVDRQRYSSFEKKEYRYQTSPLILRRRIRLLYPRLQYQRVTLGKRRNFRKEFSFLRFLYNAKLQPNLRSLAGHYLRRLAIMVKKSNILAIQ
jgi:hypothetical protein